MSRMERNKQLHKKLAQEEQQSTKESIFARRTRQKAVDYSEVQSREESIQESIEGSQPDQSAGSRRTTGHSFNIKPSRTHGGDTKGKDNYRPHSAHQKTNSYTKEQNVKQKPKQKVKQQKSKKKRRHPILRIVFRVLLFILIYSIGAFIVGQQVARSDSSIPKDDTETFNGVTSADGSNNILLIGSDSREGETGRADTIMVLQLDGPSGKPKLVSFMRDTLVTIPGYGENKINAAYAFGGADLVRQTLAENFGINTKYYTKVDFQSFEKVIDTLFPTGVSINAEKDMSKNLEVAIKKGQQDMNGLELLQYARFRMDEEGDFGRVRRQQQVIDAIFSEMKNPVSILKLPYAAGKVLGYASTNLPVTFLLKNTFSIARGAGGIDRLTVPVDDSWQYGNSATAGSVLVIDLQTNQQAITDFFNQK